MQQYTLASEMFTIEVQVQGAKVTTTGHMSQKDAMQQATATTTMDEHEHCGEHNAAIYQCTLHVFLTGPYRSG